MESVLNTLLHHSSPNICPPVALSASSELSCGSVMALVTLQPKRHATVHSLHVGTLWSLRCLSSVFLLSSQTNRSVHTFTNLSPLTALNADLEILTRLQVSVHILIQLSSSALTFLDHISVSVANCSMQVCLHICPHLLYITHIHRQPAHHRYFPGVFPMVQKLE